MKIKKLGYSLLVALFIIMLVACGSNSNDENGSVEADDSAVADYPNKSIELVIPYPAGGATDLLFRLIAKEAEQHLGQTIVPTNMEGGSATIGSRHVKDAEPDGYTILGSHQGIGTVNVAGIVDYSFEAFEPVALLTKTPHFFAVRNGIDIEDMDDLKAYIEENPGQLNLSFIPGITDHFFTAQLIKSMDLSMDDINQVSFDGTAGQVTALVAGDIDGAMMDVPSARAYLEEGTQMHPVAVTHDERMQYWEDVPTVVEQGYEMVNSVDRGLFAPKGTPEEILIKLEEAFQKVLEDPELQDKIADEYGSIVEFVPHKEYKEMLEEEQNTLEELAKDMDF